jgi:WD40 repeat protein
MVGAGGALTAFSENGRWMFRIGGDNVGRVWDAADGKDIASNAVGSGALMAAISSDGQHIAVVGPHHNLTIYDAKAARWHESHVRIPVSLGDLVDEKFSPDGSRLLLCDSVGSICVFDPVRGQTVTPTIRHHGPLASARFLGDRQFVTVTKAGMIRAWELPTDPVDHASVAPDERPVQQLIAFAQVLAGGRINELQEFEPMSSVELQSCWDRMIFR